MDVNTTYTEAQSALINDADFLRNMLCRSLQSMLDAEFMGHVKAGPYERNESRTGYRNGSYTRQLKTRVGSIELNVPRDREGVFRTELFERYQRSEKALVLALVEMYLKGVATRKVGAIVEELCGESISKSQVSELSKRLDQDFEAWRTRALDKEYAYLLLDALYIKVREGGRVESRATFVAVGIDRDGYRSIIGCHMTTSEYKAEWKSFIRSLKQRGLKIPQLVGSDDHDGLREAIVEELTGSMWQRCQVHYARNFMAIVGKRQSSKLLPFLRAVFSAACYEAAQQAKQALIDQLLAKKLAAVAEWVDETIDDCLNVLNLPAEHRKRMASTNMLERVNEEIRRRTKVIRIFPHRQSAMRIVISVCQERSESWENRKYLSFEEEGTSNAG